MIDRLRIAFIGLRGVPAGEGGIERHVEEIGARLAERGHEVTVFARSNYVRERVPVYRGMRIRYVRSAGTKHLDFIAHSAISSALVLGDRPDIVHYHAVASGLVAPIPRYLSRSKVVLTVHGLDHDRAKWGPAAKAALKLGARLSARVPHATITVSQALADHFAARLGRPAFYIPNGIPEARVQALGTLAERLGIAPGRYLLFVGRLVPEKAPDLILRAFARVEDSDARLVIAGSSGFTDEYTESLRRLAAADPRVVMPGPVFGDELAALYSNAAAFVNASDLEGLPITLLEAIAHGAPVVLSGIAPHLEVVGGDGPGHRVVPCGDAVALAEALTAALGNTAEGRVGAARLRAEVAARYRWDAAAEATERVYMRVLGRTGLGETSPLADTSALTWSETGSEAVVAAPATAWAPLAAPVAAEPGASNRPK